MIDNNKIKEAIEDYVRHSSVEDEYPGTEEDAFKAGAKWAINEFLKDLWHDAEEEPYSNLSPILLDGRDREGRQIVKTSFFRSGYWNKTVEYYDIIRWIYIDDLFPEEEEKEKEEE